MREKRAFKLLTATLMVLALVTLRLSSSSALQVNAATTSSISLSSTSVILNLGNADTSTYNFNVNNKVDRSTYSWYVRADKGSPDAVTINTKNGIVTAKKIGTAYIRVKITLPNGTVLRPEAKVTVKNNITSVGISNLPTDMTITAGEAYDFNRVILNTEGGVGVASDGITRWEIADDNAGIGNVNDSGLVLATAGGDFKIRAASFQSLEKFNQWLSDKVLYTSNVTAASDWATILVNPAKDVEATDFGVMDFSGVVGYNVGFNLLNVEAPDVESITIKVSNENGVLATATSNELLMQYPEAVSFSAPIDILGGFDYIADKSWTYSGWNGEISDIPSQAEITVNFKNGMEKTVTITELAGDTSRFTKGNLETADFGVMDFSGVVGYNVGFNLIDAKASDVESVVVEVSNESGVLATATTNELLTQYPDAVTLSVPIDVAGEFDYVEDKSWTYSGWTGKLSSIPTEADITVVFKNGIVKTIKNTNLTGDTSRFTKGNVEAVDFGVMDFSGVIGYNVGFNLIDAKASDVESVVVKVSNESGLLATATTNELLTQYPDAASLSAPFDVLGSFDYVTDKSWTYSGWNGSGKDIPTQAEIIVNFKNGTVKTIKNTNLTGDTKILTRDVETPSLGLIGYTVNVNLADAKASDVESVKVVLFSGEEELATVTSNELLSLNPEAKAFVAPFYLIGGFDYAADRNWTYSGWNGNLTDIPTKAVITVTFKNGLVKKSTKQY